MGSVLLKQRSPSPLTRLSITNTRNRSLANAVSLFTVTVRARS